MLGRRRGRNLERERAALDERCSNLVGERVVSVRYVDAEGIELDAVSSSEFDSLDQGVEIRMQSGRTVGLMWDDALEEFGMNVVDDEGPVLGGVPRGDVSSSPWWSRVIGHEITEARVIWKTQLTDREALLFPQSIVLAFDNGRRVLATASDFDRDGPGSWGADNVTVFFDDAFARRADLTAPIHDDDVPKPIPILRRLMGNEYIETERDGSVAIVTIDNPPMNALSARLLEELEKEIDGLDGDDSVRAIVLLGAGERAFVAGADISEFPSLREAATEAHERGSARGIQKLGHRMDAARTPFVAAIHGFCLGGGLELAMCCDIRVVSDDAQLGQPEIKLGLIPGGGGTQRLPRLVGIGRAQYLNMTGDFIDARTAYDWGLVEKVVPREELRGAALGIAATIAARSPVSIAVLRELARTTRDLSLEEGLRREADGFRRCLESEDGAEGVAAFLEKREPQFTGR